MINKISFYIGLVVLLILLSLAQAFTTTAQVKVAAEGMQNISEVKLMASDGAKYDEFGSSVALSGEVAIVGVPYDDDHGSSSGAAYIYRWHGNYWQEEAKLAASDGAKEDHFGNSVSISGDVAIVGAYKKDYNSAYRDVGAAYVYRWDGENWQEEAKLTSTDQLSSFDEFATSVSVHNEVIMVGSPREEYQGDSTGVVYVYQRNGESWQEETKLISTDRDIGDRFGASVYLDDDLLLVGAPLDDDNEEGAGAAYLFASDGNGWQELAKLTASDGARADNFGTSVSLDGDIAVIGVPFYGEGLASFGAAYLFRRDGTGWQEEAKLMATDALDEGHFGASVAVSGSRVLIGADGDLYDDAYLNSASLFRWNGVNWEEEGKLTAYDGARNDNFGVSVALNGEMALVGATLHDGNLQGEDTGAAYLYDLSAEDVPDITLLPSSVLTTLVEGNSQTVPLRVVNSGNEPLEWAISGEYEQWLSFTPASGTVAAGESTTVMIGLDASTLTSGFYPETVLITTNDPDEQLVTVPLLLKVGRRTTEVRLTAQDRADYDKFGRSMALTGELAIVGAPYDDHNALSSGAAYIYRWEGERWQEEAKLSASDGAAEDYFGHAVSIQGDLAVVGAYKDDDRGNAAGSAYVYRWDGSHWNEEAKLTASDGTEDDYFGTSVAVYDDVVLVGASKSHDEEQFTGAAYIFRFNGNNWQEDRLEASDGANGGTFGGSVSLDGDVALIGAGWNSREHGGFHPSSAYIFRFDGSNWQEEAKLFVEDGLYSDFFGASVSISGNLALISASGDENNGSDSGAAYLFGFDGLSWQQEAKLTPSDGTAQDHFGSSVSLNGNMALVGAVSDDDNGQNVGSAYLFRWDGNHWQEEVKLLASDGDENDYFGRAVALNGEKALIGATGSNDLVTDATGRAYFYNLSPSNVPDISLSASHTRNVLTQGTSTTGTLSLKNNGFEPLVWQINGADEAWLTISESSSPPSGTLAVNESLSLTLTFDASLLTAGQYTETLTITSNDPDESTLELPLLLEVLYPEPELTFSASNLLAIAAEGMTSTRTLIIQNEGTVPREWAISGDYEDWLTFSPTSGTLTVNQSLSVTLGFDASLLRRGAYTETLRLSTSDSNWPSLELPLSFQVMPPESKLIPNDNLERDYFGSPLSVSGQVAIIGASGDDTHGDFSGAAYIYRQLGSNWEQEAKLTASDAIYYETFGRTVSIDDDIAIIGANATDYWTLRDGSAYIFRSSGSTWQEEAKLTASDKEGAHGFGRAVAVDDEIVVIGAHEDDTYYNSLESGAAYIFRWDGSSWDEEAKLTLGDGTDENDFGKSVAISENIVLVGDTRNDRHGEHFGAVYVYRFDGQQWQQEAILTASDETPNDNFASSVAISGNIALVSASGNDYNGENSGAVYVYRFSGNQWHQEAKLTPSDQRQNHYFGQSISINEELAIIGAQNSAYLFGWNGERWQEEGKLLATDKTRDSSFGRTVSINRDIALVGAFGDDSNGSYSGAAYAYQLSDMNISPQNISIILSPGEQSTDTLTITNHSTDTLTYSLTEDAPWLTVTPQNGSVARETSQRLALTIDATNLKAGSYRHTLSLSTNHPDYESVNIPVTVTVTEPTSITLSGLSATSPSGAQGGLMLMMLGLGWVFWKEGVQRLLCQ